MVSYRVIAILLVVLLHFWFGGCTHAPLTPPHVSDSEGMRMPSDAEGVVPEGFTKEALVTIQKFSNAGFDCVRKERVTRCMADENEAQQFLAGYNRPVAILIPNQLPDPQPGQAAINQFLYFFHGHDVNSRGFEWYLSNFKVDRQFGETGFKRTLLIMPASQGNCEDFERFFGHKPKKFDEFNFAIMRILRMNPNQLTSISLSGHSGSYRVIANLATNQTRARVSLQNTLRPLINQVGLLDATYGDVPRFYGWAAGDQKNRKLIISCATSGPCEGMNSIIPQNGSVLSNIILSEIANPKSFVAIEHYDLGIQCLRATWEARSCR